MVRAFCFDLSYFTIWLVCFVFLNTLLWLWHDFLWIFKRLISWIHREGWCSIPSPENGSWNFNFPFIQPNHSIMYRVFCAKRKRLNEPPGAFQWWQITIESIFVNEELESKASTGLQWKLIFFPFLVDSPLSLIDKRYSPLYVWL